MMLLALVVTGLVLLGTFALTFSILVEYFDRYREGGLLPQHIWLIASAHLTYTTAGLVVVLRSFLEDRFAVEILLFLGGGLLGLQALWKIRRQIVQRSRR